MKGRLPCLHPFQTVVSLESCIIMTDKEFLFLFFFPIQGFVCRIAWGPVHSHDPFVSSHILDHKTTLRNWTFRLCRGAVQRPGLRKGLFHVAL